MICVGFLILQAILTIAQIRLNRRVHRTLERVEEEYLRYQSILYDQLVMMRGELREGHPARFDWDAWRSARRSKATERGKVASPKTVYDWLNEDS